jgi:hypothetical protein
MWEATASLHTPIAMHQSKKQLAKFRTMVALALLEEK